MDNAQLRGDKTPGDQRFPVALRDWNGLKLALWRSSELSRIVVREARLVLDTCRHTEGCPGHEAEQEPCDPRCPDRETRMSALVILNAARQLAPENARKPAEERYFAPSREYFSEVIAALSAAQVENKILRDALHDAGLESPLPSSGAVAPLELTIPTPREDT